jgi:hypothetical protein
VSRASRVYRLAYNGDVVGFKMGRRPRARSTTRLDDKLAAHRRQLPRGVSSFVGAQPVQHMLDSFGYNGLERSAFDFAFD